YPPERRSPAGDGRGLFRLQWQSLRGGAAAASPSQLTALPAPSHPRPARPRPGKPGATARVATGAEGAPRPGAVIPLATMWNSSRELAHIRPACSACSISQDEQAEQAEQAGRWERDNNDNIPPDPDPD